jgi:signal peptidase I
VFGFLTSNERKMRENAENWLQLADKICHYRRDQLTTAQMQELRKKIAALRQMLQQRADAGKLKLGIESLEGLLQQVGGTFYPKSSIVENVEFFLVAAIIVLGIRSYFLQPFKIPTNSMWPTYYGMKGENLPPGTPAPGLLERAFRLVAFGAQRREVIAPQAGEVSAMFFPEGTLAYTLRDGHKWLVVPTRVREYTFSVDGTPATVLVPADFHDFDLLFQETFFGSTDGFRRFLATAGKDGRVERTTVQVRDDADSTRPGYLIRLGKTVQAGEAIMRFDILTGDQLFVDRLSYHFMRPPIGSGFVFRTGNIEGLKLEDGDQYFIKRLVGAPSDTLEIRGTELWRNGQPITGAAAFGKNARREGRYPGYRNYGLLSAGEKLTVPPNVFFALGDNSPDSKDGRFWGFVPAKDVIGRPLFIYYPFARRWGPAR